MPEARWKGYIKDYNGSTMMQCIIHKDIDYVNISQTIRSQKDVFYLMLLTVSLVPHQQNFWDYDKEEIPWT